MNQQKKREAALCSTAPPFFPIHLSILSMYCEPPARKKNEGAAVSSDSLLGGGYLRLPMSQTISVVTLRALFQEWDRGGAA